jgi:hypothetical protein
MPELPEVESARTVIERAALGRRITTVDDSDSYVCRPHPPGQIRDALVGRHFVTACRLGKALWCPTSPVDGSVAEGPPLGIHLGMSGKIVIAEAYGTEIDGGDYWEGRRTPGDYRWSRFRLTFDDGGTLMLVDRRRLGRIRLDPPLDLGPDAATVTDEQIHAAITHGTTPIKARLLDQRALAVPHRTGPTHSDQPRPEQHERTLTGRRRHRTHRWTRAVSRTSSMIRSRSSRVVRPRWYSPRSRSAGATSRRVANYPSRTPSRAWSSRSAQPSISRRVACTWSTVSAACPAAGASLTRASTLPPPGEY